MNVYILTFAYVTDAFMELRREKDNIRNKILPRNILQSCQEYCKLNAF